MNTFTDFYVSDNVQAADYRKRGLFWNLTTKWLYIIIPDITDITLLLTYCISELLDMKY